MARMDDDSDSSPDCLCNLCGVVIIPEVSLAFVFLHVISFLHAEIVIFPVFFLFPGWAAGMQGVPKGAEIYLPLV